MKLPLLILIPASLVMLPADAQERKPYDESIESERNFSLFGGPTREGPEAEWEIIQEAVADEKLKRAIKHTEYLVRAWPDHPLAVQAQRLQGDLYFAREDYLRAFNAYQALIDGFAGRFDYDEVLRQQLETARKLEHQDHHAFFGLSTFKQPRDAIEPYRQLLTNAPQMPEAPRILYDIGEIYMRTSDFREAIREFELLEQRYPRHPLAEESVLRTADAYLKLAERNPTDVSPLEGALNTLSYFLNRYPGSASVPEVRLRRRDAYDRLAEIRFEQAKFYEENLRKPRAALVGYRALVEQFPDSEWTAPARERILALTDKEN